MSYSRFDFFYYKSFQHHLNNVNDFFSLKKKKELQPSHFAAPIIQKMIEHLPEKRIPLSEVKELLLSVSTDERDGPSDNGWGVSGFQPLYNFSDPPSNVMSFFAARAKMEVRGGA